MMEKEKQLRPSDIFKTDRQLFLLKVFLLGIFTCFLGLIIYGLMMVF